MSLPQFSVRQIVLVNLIFLALMIAGFFVSQRIPIDLFPDISFYTAEITTIWPGASPDEVERLVTSRIEEEIDDIVGTKQLFSFSSDGLSQITVEWDETLSDSAYEAALSDLRAALDRVDDLPADAERPILREISVSEVYNICMIAVADVAGVGEFTLRAVARDIQKKLEHDIPGLRRAELRGEREREIRVYVDRRRAHQYDLTLAEINQVIAQNNQNFPGGSFTNPFAQEITVRGLGHFGSPQELSRTVVRKNPDGTHVLLGDLAQVEEGFEKRRFLGRYNGKPAIIIGISKEVGADVLDLVEEVRAFLVREAGFLPEGIEASLTWDQSNYVAVRLRMMRDNLLLGVVLVIGLLWVTVGLRNALLAIVGVPFSFLTAMLLFPVFDITINALSLVGFILVSGMLVDDAIIILENIYRHVEEGLPVREAVIQGTEEVMWPVTAAIVTTMAAFLPLLTVTGTSGEFMSILPKTVVVCLLGSLVEALLILPAHYLDWGSRRRAADALAEGAQGRSRLGRWSLRTRAGVEAGLARFRERYLRALDAVLARRGFFLAACFACFFFATGLAQHVPVDLFPSDFNNLFVTIKTPTDFGIDQTERVARGAEQALVPIADQLTDMTVYAGFGLSADQVPVSGVNYAAMFLTFPNTRENVAHPDRVLNLVREHLSPFAAAHPDEIDRLVVAEPRNGPPIGKPVAVRIQADDYQVAKEIADQIQDFLAGTPGVFNVEDNLPVGPRELRVRLDEYRASIHGLSFAEVGQALRAANDGLVATTFKDPTSDEDLDIRVLLAPEQRTTTADLLDVEVRTREGQRVKLGDVASIELERGFQRLYHYEARRAAVVYADVDNRLATSVSVNRELAARFRDVPLRYPGVTLVFGGEFQKTQQALSDTGRAMILALIAIYGILAAQFRSYIQPFIVMSVVAFAFIGVIVGIWFVGLWADGYALSMYVLFAIVGLAGIVVNDSLVLLDFVNQERRRGTPAWEAVRIAGSKRFRPILLTTLTTILGLAPMALGISGRSPVFGPFAAAIVFGLAAASGLTLLLVPALYLTLEDARGLVRSLRAGPAAAGRDEAGAGQIAASPPPP